MISALVQAGADLNVRDRYGLTSLMFAARCNKNPEVIMTLLKAGADTKKKDNEGKTAFDYAQDNEQLKGTGTYWRLQEVAK